MVRPRRDIGVSKYAWILAVPAVLMGTICAAATHTSHESPPAAMRQMGTICKFTSGPRAGATQDYAPMQAPLNSPCKDGSGSTGTIVASAPIGETAVNQQMGTVCKFTSGPRAGATQDYAPMQAPVDMSCTDGAGSSGTIVASATPPETQESGSPQTGSVCKFTSGPKAGSTHDYAPMHAPLNTACDDGAGSSGVIIAALPMGTVCKFTSGPKAGSTHDYAPMHAPLNTACDDGAGSSGVIIAATPKPPMGTVCKFTSGPKAGSTHDYAPMHAPLNTACDDGAGSSGVIIAAQPMGTVCKFTSGPKTGSTHDYAPMHSPLGTACDDGAGSSGVIIAAPIADTPSCTPPSACTVAPNTKAPNATAPSATVPSSATTSASAGASAPGSPQAGLGSVCKLTSGPKAGTTYDFAPMQAAIGAPCNYGPDNTGVIIAGTSQPPPPKPVPPAAPVMGSVCSFTSGPLALTTADFSPKRAPLGTPCTDEHGSHGVIVEH